MMKKSAKSKSIDTIMTVKFMIQYHNRKLRVDKKGRIKIRNGGDKSRFWIPY